MSAAEVELRVPLLVGAIVVKGYAMVDQGRPISLDTAKIW